MNFSLLFITALLQSRPALILALGLGSGYTTYIGLKLFVPSLLAFVITWAVQTMIVIATVQLMHVPWRIRSASAAGISVALLASVGVSVFFSYFTFFGLYEEPTIRRARFERLSSSITDFIIAVQSAKQDLMQTHLRQAESMRQKSMRAELGFLDDQDIGRGEGPVSRLFRREADRLESMLVDLRAPSEAEELALELKTLIAQISPADLTSEETYGKVSRALSDTAVAADRFAAAHGLEPIPVPTLVGFEEYQRISPEHMALDSLSPISFFLALMVDVFTVLLTVWIETVPVGRLNDEEKTKVVRQIMEFSKWDINRSGNLEFDKSKTDAERREHYNDGNRLFYTTLLLDRGYLRQIDESRVAFTARLYPIFSRSLTEREKGANDGG